MSVDFMVFSAAGVEEDEEFVPEGWNPQPLGDPASVRKAIESVLPDVAWENPTFGVLERDGFGLEFGIPAESPATSFTIYLRGLPPQELLAELCSANDWVAVDDEGGFVQNRGRSL